MLNLCKNLFTDLNNSQVKYCHWKSNLRLSGAVAGQDDLDLLFDSHHIIELTSVLNKNGFKYAQSQYGSSYHGIEDWLGFDQETGRLIHLHVHYKLTTGISRVKQATVPWADYALNNTIMTDSGVKVICPEIELLLLYVRNIFKLKLSGRIKNALRGYHFDQHDMEEIEYLKQYVDNSRMLSIAEDLFNQANAQLITDLMCKKTVGKDDLVKLSSYCGKFFRDSQNESYLYANILSSVRQAVILCRYYFNKRQRFIPVKKTFNHGGRIIAFIGADGTGKTTLTSAIIKWLSWKLDVRTAYFGSGDGYKNFFSVFIGKAGGIKIRRAEINTSSDDRKNSLQRISLRKYIGRNLSCLNIINLAKNNKKTLARMNRYRNKGGIAIVDRYPQAQVKGIYDGPKVETTLAGFKDTALKKYLIRKEMKYFKILDIVQPDVVFKLVLPPEISMQRKPDHNIAEVFRKAEITKILVYPKSKVYEIDVNRDLDAILLDIKRLIWESL
jgi:thymidylate kinase